MTPFRRSSHESPMNCTVIFTALTALIASSGPCLAQTSSSLPVIRPKVTQLGEIRDTTLNGSLMPQEAALSPRGTLIAYTTWDDLRIWNVRTHSNRVVLKGDSEGIVWSPAGDAIAFRRWGRGFAGTGLGAPPESRLRRSRSDLHSG